MIGKFKQTFDLTPEELLDVLKNIRVKRSINRNFSRTSPSYHWTNFKNPQKLKLVSDDLGPLNPYPCFGKIISQNLKSTLIIQMRPAYAVLVILVVFTCFLIDAIISFGQHNYGTPGFWPSVIVPSFFVALMYIVWILLFQSAARKFNNEIVQSIEERISVYELK